MFFTKRNKRSGMILNTPTDDNEIKLKKYELLYSAAVSQMLPSLDSYRDGKFDVLNTQFTPEIYTELGKQLADDTRYTDNIVERIPYRPRTFTDIKSSFHNVLDGLNRGKLQYIKEVECSDKVDTYETILHTPENLVNYYNRTYKKSAGTFEELDVNTILTETPVVNQEYDIYVQRHGLPCNGIFESEKLSIILLELERA